MQEELHIDPVRWGWVTAMFGLAYGIFEIPTGALGDRIGARRVLTRVVLWWSAFTALTGAVSNFVVLLATRFFFGMGEAGAFPNASIVISRWFPSSQRASISGVILMASQIGGAIAPLLIVPIQLRYGWRASFFVFGVLGVVWASAWYAWFRDSPAEKAGVTDSELAETDALPPRAGHGLAWSLLLQSPTMLSLAAIAFCYVYTYNFFQTWFHTFLVSGRGFSEAGLLLSALPYALAAVANVTGGAVSDTLVRRVGLKWGRRAVGTVALSSAGIFTLAAMVTHDQWLTVVFLSLVYGSITFQQSGVFGACLDIGRAHAGAVVGLINTSAQAGGLIASIGYGYMVERWGYDAPFVPMAVLLFAGAALWMKVDTSTDCFSVPVNASLSVEPISQPVVSR